MYLCAYSLIELDAFDIACLHAEFDPAFGEISEP